MKTFTTLLFILFIWSGCLLQLHAQSRSAVKIGNISEVRAKFETKAKEIKNGKHAQVSHHLPGQAPLILNLKSSKKKGFSDYYYGEVDNAKNSNFYLKVEGEEVTGSIVLRDEKKYYSYSSLSNGSVLLAEEDIDEVLCVGYPESAADDSFSGSSVGAGLAAVPVLESLPDAESVVLLDFDGHTVANTLWNSTYNNGDPIVAEPANLSESEMVAVWKLMSEDFRPFELNVTTSEAVFNNAPVDQRVRVIFTPTNYFLPGWGGYAYIGSFTWGGTTHGETPTFVWNSGVIGAGEAGSHEVGHTLGLVHDGRTDPYNEAYYYGHDSWAPIMGIGYSKPVVQWSKGEYPYANNTEDDLEIIATRNGFGYRVDDHGNSDDEGTPLIIDGGGYVLSSANNGVITTRTDVDVFSFTTSGGSVALNVDPDPSYPNLDIVLTLRNSAGSVITTADPPTLAASIDQVLEAGTYYLEIDGVMGSLGANSDYASLGEYFISGNISTNVGLVVNITSPANGQTFTTSAPVMIEAEASDEDGSIVRVEFFSGDTKLGEDLEAPYAYSWSGMAAGTHTLTARATNNLGATTTSGPVVVTVIDNQPPVVSITSPTNGQNFKAPATITIEAEASDEDGSVTMVEFFNGDTKLGEDWEAPYTFNWNSMPTGSYTLIARATDNLGDTASASVRVTVTKNQSPVVSITAPGNGQNFSAPATILIEADASDADGTIAKVEFFSGDTKLGEALEAPYTYHWSGVGAGSYTLTARATDNDGASTISGSVTVEVSENQPPVISITSPSDGQNFTAPAHISITADASDADGTVEKVEFFNGDTKLGEALEAPYSYSWNGVAAGSYTLTARATDNNGRITTSGSVSVTVIDNQPPVVSITSPTNGQNFKAPATITIEAEASDEDGSVTMVEFFNGETKLGEDREAPYTYSWSGMAAGSYTLTVRATDNSGATTSSDAVVVNVTGGNQSPVVSITSPHDGHLLTIPQNPIHISVDASDADGRIVKVELFNGDTKLGEVMKAPYTYSWRQPHRGTYAITARATDNLGATTISDAVLVTVILPGKGNQKKNKASASRKASSTVAGDEESGEPGVYPNPVTVNHMLKVDLQFTYTAIKIVLHELSTGKKVSEHNYSNTRAVELDVSTLSHGLYGMTITAEDMTWTKKIIALP